jgi:membrane protease YdiL (CAAX protease family)
MERQQAWRKIATYLVLVAVFTVLATALLAPTHLPSRLKAAGNMWVPGLSAIFVKLVFDRSLKGLGLTKSGGVWLVVALALPAAYALPVYLSVWVAGLGGFDPERWAGAIPYYTASSGAATALAVLLTLGLFDKLSRALGEEIGWRGFLLPELAKVMSLRAAGLLSGAIWTLWHMPAFFYEGYNSGNVPLAYQLGCFAVMVTSSALFYAWIRMESQSVWPAAMLHAAHNLLVQSILDQATVNGPRTLLFTGEFGCGLAVTSVVVAWLVWPRLAPKTRLTPRR